LADAEPLVIRIEHELFFSPRIGASAPESEETDPGGVIGEHGDVILPDSIGWFHRFLPLAFGRMVAQIVSGQPGSVLLAAFPNRPGWSDQASQVWPRPIALKSF